MWAAMDTLESILGQYASAIRNVIRQEVFAELRNLTLNELVEISKGGGVPSAPARRAPGRPKATAISSTTKAGGRRLRRSAGDIHNLLEKVVSYVRDNPGARSTDIVKGLGIAKKHLPRAINEGLTAGTLTKTGERRATKYFSGETKRRKG
jgi:hypothetical protein